MSVYILENKFISVTSTQETKCFKNAVPKETKDPFVGAGFSPSRLAETSYLKSIKGVSGLE